MKHLRLLLPCLFSIAGSLYAQSDSLLTTKVDSLQQLLFRTQSTYRDSLQLLRQQYMELSQHVQWQGQMIRELRERRRASARTQHERHVQSIRQTVLFCEQSSRSLQAIQNSIAGSYYFNTIGSLHNPTNQELGFSLKEATIRLAQEKIFSRVKRFKKGARLVALMQHIFDSPLSQAVSEVIPTIHYFQSITQLIYKAAFEEEDIAMSDLKAFEEELQKYLRHYEALSEANREFQQNLSSLRVRSQALHQLLLDFVRQQSSSLHPGKRTEIARLPLQDLINHYYQYSHVDSLIRNIEASYTEEGIIQYEPLVSDARLMYPVIGIQKVHQIDQELEALYREYLSLLDGYHQRIEEILRNSRQLSQQPEAIDKKIQELQEQYGRLRAEIVRSVNIEQVHHYMHRIPLY
ncbi:MAG: hypothetical protein KatS3mg033_2489 [Thermonema sp.]|uniref:hypothetical protein n=1 Tax=Thermonema TaxID=28194 RepID=UPI000570D6AC|nr:MULTISPECIES: hypothetical protein [Thermonema]GIV40689.1 MAG: hypothetical protein KatS3mg033_2489 [Thermonema sp.]